MHLLPLGNHTDFLSDVFLSIAQLLVPHLREGGEASKADGAFLVIPCLLSPPPFCTIATDHPNHAHL